MDLERTLHDKGLLLLPEEVFRGPFGKVAYFATSPSGGDQCRVSLAFSFPAFLANEEWLGKTRREILGRD